MSTHKMSRDTRKVFQTIEALGTKHGVQGETIPAHIYMADMLLIRFHAKPICNILSARIEATKKREPKHYTFEYWLPALSNMLKNNISAVRPNPVSPTWLPRSTDDVLVAFEYITNGYLLVDYGYEDMYMIQKIVNTYESGEVAYACMIGKSNKVYEVRYINAVLEKERAKKQVKIDRLDVINQKIDSSDKMFERPIHKHGIMELASMQYSWEQKRENARIERELDQILRRDGR